MFAEEKANGEGAGLAAVADGAVAVAVDGDDEEVPKLNENGVVAGLGASAELLEPLVLVDVGAAAA